MAPSNPTNPSSSPAPATPKLVSALNVLQISREFWPTFLDCSMILTSPSPVKRNLLNMDSAVACSHSAKQDQTPIQPLPHSNVWFLRYSEIPLQRILALGTGSMPAIRLNSPCI